MEWGEYTGIFRSGDRVACNDEAIDGYFGENKSFTGLSGVGGSRGNGVKIPGMQVKCRGIRPLPFDAAARSL